jgi:BCD family chlorophyll transporter-like MFS transporter
MQDGILEPYAADVFGWGVEQTTRLTGYWGSATVLVLVSSLIIWRKRRPEEQTNTSQSGLLVMALGMGILVASATSGNTSVFMTGLILFGAGFGLYTFGGLSLMVAMSPDPHSGAYLGLWTVAILVSKGLGTLLGGIIRDLMLLFGSATSAAYGVIFLVASLGLLAAAVIISRIDVSGFIRDSENPNLVQNAPPVS